MLQRVELRGVGPAEHLAANFGSGLNMITGDNGLGKSFLLDVAWWALTRSWAGPQAAPNKGAERTAALSYSIVGQVAPVENEIEFDVQRWGWFHGRGRPPIPGFVVYARVDGGFAVMDPARNEPPPEPDEPGAGYLRRPTAFFFDSGAVWTGLRQNDGPPLCNGLIADWHSWQLEDAEEFQALKLALATLSPDPSEPLVPGPSQRFDLLDAREIPTLRMPYGDVPVTRASAGVRRVLALAYLLVWAWHEHRGASELLGQPPSNRVTLLIDEVEAHLHPHWQRLIMPAVLDALAGLGAPDSQAICVTHAPLVLASLEGRWNPQRDRLFTFDLATDGVGPPGAELHETPWRTHGDVNAWLTSEVFQLGQARSVQAERVIEHARDIMSRPGEDVKALGELARELAELVPESDPLLARLDALSQRDY